MFRKSLLLGLSLVLLAALSVVSSAGSAPFAQTAIRGSSASSFTDAAGDSGAAPDITDVEVGNDVVAGPIVIWVTLANRPDGLTGDEVLVILLDTDRNPATGDEGTDYVVGVDAEGAGAFQWDGTTYAALDVPSLKTTFVKSLKAIRFEIHPNDLGGTPGFTFFVQSFAGEEFDVAPNGPPDWPYTLATGRIGLSVLDKTLFPKKPVAGKKLDVVLLVIRRDLDEGLSVGKVSCQLGAGTKNVRTARKGFSSGFPSCRWTVPKSAKGKLVTGSISVTYGGVTVKRSFSARAG